MNWHIYNVIGARVETDKFKEALLLAKTYSAFSPKEVCRTNKVVLVDALTGYSYICSYVHSFEINNNKLLNYGPLVHYQDKNWDKDKVRRFLEQFRLWEDGSFGIWTFAVRE